MCKPKILITVEGGMIQNIISNTNIEVIIADFDVDSDDDKLINIQHGEEDELFVNGKAHNTIKVCVPMDEGERELYEYLKEVKF